MQSEAELVLNLFLKFGIFEARCSYKIVLIKKKRVVTDVEIFQLLSLSHTVI